MFEAVPHIQRQPDYQPRPKSDPRLERQSQHHVDAEGGRHGRHHDGPRHPEGSGAIWIGPAQDQDARRDQSEREQRADVREIVGLVGVADECPHGDEHPCDDRRDVGDAAAGGDAGRPRRQQAIARHREEDARLAVLEHQQYRRHRYDRAKRDDPSDSAEPRHLERPRERIGHAQLRVLHHSREHGADDHVDQRTDRQAAENPNGKIALRILRFLGGGRDRVKADIGEEHDRGALVNAAPAIRRKRCVVRRIEVAESGDDEEGEHQQFDDDEDVVRARALAHAQQQQPRDQPDDEKRGQVDQDRDAGHVGRALQQAVDGGVGAEQRGAISGRNPDREMDAKVAHQRVEVVAP